MKVAGLSSVAEAIRKQLKQKTTGGDTPAWIGMRTVLDCSSLINGMGGRTAPILKYIEPELKGTFLDVGCYGGWLYPKVRDRVEYTGIDNWPDAIESAKTLFGDRFHCCDLRDYRTQHDIVWATQLHPEVDIPIVFDHLRGLSKKMLVVTFPRDIDAIPGGEVLPLLEGVGVIYRFGG